MQTRAVDHDLSLLRGTLGAQVVLPGDATWDTSRQPWNLARDQHPRAVALPRSARDVQAIVRVAAEHGLRVAPQGSGHGAGPLGDLDGTILVRTGHLDSVSIDPDARRARVGSGVRWRDVAGPASGLGLAGLMGSSPDVGVAGYTLGGGMGWLARRYGFAANAVQAIEVVTADGNVVWADHDRDADLFWALRGGGGGYGVVTALEFELFPVAQVYAGSLFWPIERARDVIAAWRDVMDGLPREITSAVRLFQFPPLPQLPEPLRGRSFVVIGAACLLPPAEADALLRPWRAMRPDMDTFAVMPPAGLGAVAMDPEDPTPAVGDGMLLGGLPDEGIDALLGETGPGAASPLLVYELRQMGGAMAESSPGHGALDKMDAAVAVYGVGLALDPESGARVKDRLARLERSLAPWYAGRYFNFAEAGCDADAIFPPGTYRRLQDVRRRYDPGAVFQANHEVSVGPD